MIRVDILVSSPIFLAGLVQVVTDAGIRVVAVRTSAVETPSWLADAALIDIDSLPKDDVLSPIREAARGAAVLVLCDGDGATVSTCLQAGASGVVDRRESGDHVVDAVRAVTVGRCVTPDGVDPCPPARMAAASDRPLSPREEQVLRQIARGLTHGQIARRLGISPHTVDTYVKRIRAKLDVGNKAELTRAALLRNGTAGDPSDAVAS